MAFVTPKTNWTSTDGVTNVDLNRIEENTRVLSQQGNAFGVTTGAANTYAVTAVPAITALSAGTAVAIQINVDNTGASTINVNGLGPKSIKKANGNDVGAANLKAGSIYTLRYNGTNFILQGEGGGEGTAVAADVLAPKTFTNSTGQVITGTAKDVLSTTQKTDLANAINAAEDDNNALVDAGKADISDSINAKGGITSANDSFTALAGAIDSLPVKRFKTGTGGTITGTKSFIADDGTSLNYNQFIVTGLGFTPTAVMLWRSNEATANEKSGVTVYPQNLGTSAARIAIYQINNNEGYYDDAGSFVRLDGTNAYLIPDSFAVPVPGGMSALNTSWLALE